MMGAGSPLLPQNMQIVYISIANIWSTALLCFSLSLLSCQLTYPVPTASLTSMVKLLQLSGSCHCRAVTFKVASKTPIPYMLCYCSICRKTQGGSGATINIMAESETLEVVGTEHISIYRANMNPPGQPPKLAGNMRHFCKLCGSHLWAWDPKYAQSIYPVAGAIDTELPPPPERNHIMLDYAPAWVLVPGGPTEHHYGTYPSESIADWHKNHGW